jgi:serine/threonine protein kinase
MGAGRGEQLGKYELLERLGRGGMAEVFRARYRGTAGTQRDVVIKRMLPFPEDERDEMNALFVTEARLSMQLTHGNVVQVFDFGEEDGQYYLVMELVDGLTLASVLETVERLEPAVAVALMIEVLRGLHYAHTRTGNDGTALKIVHRDVSPDNVLLGRDGQVKLTDFGIARASLAGRSRTEPGVYRGKMSYSAPEQLRADPVDARADVYACGIVLWKCLTGQNPQAELAARLAMGTARLPAPPRSLIGDELADILVRATALDPDERTASAQELRAALQRWLDRQQAAQPELAISQLVSSATRRKNARDDDEVSVTRPSSQSLPGVERRPTVTVTHTAPTGSSKPPSSGKWIGAGIAVVVIVASIAGFVVTQPPPVELPQDDGALRPLPRQPVVPPPLPPQPAPAKAAAPEPAAAPPAPAKTEDTLPKFASGAPASFKLSNKVHGTDLSHAGLKIELPGEKTLARINTDAKFTLLLAPAEKGPIQSIGKSYVPVSQPMRLFLAQPTGWSIWQKVELELKWTQGGVTRTRVTPGVIGESMLFLDNTLRLDELDARTRYRVTVKSGSAPVLVVAESPADRLHLRTGEPTFSGGGPPWQRLITGEGSVEVRGAASLRFTVLTWPDAPEELVEVSVVDAKIGKVVIEKGSADAKALDRARATSTSDVNTGPSRPVYDANTPDQCLARAEALINRGYGRDAIPYLEKCLQLQPSNSRCSVLLGRAKSM